MCEISVIIPVYNCEAFLRRCLDSLEAQSFKDWEAVCIDDGSKDDSPRILDEYAASDSRIRVVHKKNEGVSAARNKALELVKGRYILFVDSDDFLHPQTMEITWHFAEKDVSDLVAFTYNRSYRTLRMLANMLNLPEGNKVNFPEYRIKEIESIVSDNIYDQATEYSSAKDGQDKRWLVKHCQPWRCLYRADKIKGIRFIPGIIYEDFPWWGEVLLNSSRATIINLPLYYYYPNKGSYIISSRQQFRIESLKTALKAAEDLYESRADEKQKEAWEKNFLTPFRRKLEKKLKKYGEGQA